MVVPPLIVQEIYEREILLEMLNETKESVNRPPPVDGFTLGDKEFKKLFRVNHSLARYLCQTLEEELKPRTRRRDTLSVERKVLCALQYFGSGSYQQSLGSNYTISMSQKSVSNCLSAFCDAVIKVLMPRWIYYPSKEEKLNAMKQKFFEEYGIPDVVGIIDGSHFNIVPPPAEKEHMYVNEKNKHSINVQVICDSDLSLLYVNPRYPGSVEEAFIWSSSTVRNAFESRLMSLPHASYYLLGDSGYPLEPWLLTPFANPQTQAEQRYNRAFTSAHSCAKKAFGLLRKRFRCLRQDKVLHYSPTVAGKIILTCAVLHNMCLKHHVEYESDSEDNEDSSSEDGDNPSDEDSEDDYEDSETEALRLEGEQIRRLLVHSRFT